MVEEHTPKRSKRLLWWLGGLVGAYAFIGFVLVPSLAKGQLVPFVQERLGLNTSIARIRFNPFTFTVSIADLDFLDERGEQVLALDSAKVNLQAMQSLRGVVSLRELTLNGLHIGVHRYSNGDLNLAMIANRFTESSPPVQSSSTEEEDGQMPIIEIAQLRLDGASIGIIDEVPVIPFRTLIESIDFNLNNLSTVPQSSAEQDFTLALGDGSQLRWDGELTLSPLSSTGIVQLFGPITDVAYRYFQAQIPVELEGGWFDSTLNYEVGLGNDGAFNVQLHNLRASLKNLDIVSLNDRTRLAFLPTIAISGGEFNLLEKSMQIARVQLDDFEILPVRLTDGSINFLNILSALPQEDSAQETVATVTEPAAPWDVNVAELVVERWQIQARDEVPTQSVEVTANLGARATNISNSAGVPINIDTDISLSSGGALRAGGALLVLPEFGFTGEFSFDEFGLPVLQPYLENVANIGLESGRFGVSGNVIVSPSQTEFSGSISLDDLAITDRIQNEALFGVEGLRIDTATVSVGAQNNVEIGIVRVSEPYARVEIESDGTTNIGRVMVATQPQDSSSPDSATAQSAELPTIMLERIVIERASADFSDSSLPLPFAVHMDGLGGDISALSTRSSEPARVDLEGRVDEFGQVTINGRLRPLDFASLTEIDLAFRNLDIPSLSPYVIKFAGRKIAEGDLDVDLSYRINEEQLSGANSMVMRDLVLGERVPNPDAFDLPLGLAIALLKDRNGVIDLDVPVTGNLNNPQFSFGSVISRALANIITNIVSSPFRFLANLVGGADDDEIGIVVFPPGRADLAPPEREKLLKLGAALVERPQLQLGLTGTYVADADRSALQESFFDARLSSAIANVSLQPDAPASPSTLRMQVLESLYLESAEGPDQQAAAQAFLIELQQQHLLLNAEPEAQIDTLAYSEALRRMLIALELVTDTDLANLASERAASIERELTSANASLSERLRREGNALAVELAEGRIPLSLSLTALSN